MANIPASLEIVANSINALSIVLAGRNSIHTWWTGICGCVLFAWLFGVSRLYADVALQVFFIATCFIGLKKWSGRDCAAIRRTPMAAMQLIVVAAFIVAAFYSWLLLNVTDALSPIPDSFVLVFSVVAQALLMLRRVETWWFWLAANSVAVPLFVSRELYLTAALYAAFWINALVSLGQWRRMIAR